jgi:hypothetical protein
MTMAKIMAGKPATVQAPDVIRRVLLVQVERVTSPAAQRMPWPAREAERLIDLCMALDCAMAEVLRGSA